MKRFFPVLVLGLMSVLPQAVLAQGATPPECRIVPEAIINLHPPFFGTPTVWDATFGDNEGLIQFSGAVTLENKNLLVVGEKLDRAYEPLEHVMVELNSRARAIDDKRYPAKKGERSTGILETDSGYIVSSNIFGGARGVEKWTRLAWYDKARHYKTDMILKDPVFDFESQGVADAVGGNGFVALVHAVNRMDESDQHGMIFRISDSGKLLWKRAYRPGIPNQIYGVNVADGRHYIAAGRIRNEDGRMAGWILKLNDDGTIVWQYAYPRGESAVFRHGFVKVGDQAGEHYVLAGQVMPYGSMPSAAWVTEIDTMGQVVWQRYLSADQYDLDARNVRAYDGGRISVMANATRHLSQKAKEIKREDGEDPFPNHIRLLELSPRGMLQRDEAYLNGRNAQASQILNGWNGERIVTAFIETGGDVKDNPEAVELIAAALTRQEQDKVTPPPAASTQGPPAPTPEQAAVIAQSMAGVSRHEGWVFVATSLDPYEDPCAVPEMGSIE